RTDSDAVDLGTLLGVVLLDLFTRQSPVEDFDILDAPRFALDDRGPLGPFDQPGSEANIVQTLAAPNGRLLGQLAASESLEVAAKVRQAVVPSRLHVVYTTATICNDASGFIDAAR